MVLVSVAEDAVDAEQFEVFFAESLDFFCGMKFAESDPANLISIDAVFLVQVAALLDHVQLI